LVRLFRFIAFAGLILMEVALIPINGKAQSITRGEFRLPHEVRWENSILPTGDYVYFVDANKWPAVVRVEQKGGAFSGVFVAQGMVRPVKHNDSGLSMEDHGTGAHVVSLYMRGDGGELFFPEPDADGEKPPDNEDHGAGSDSGPTVRKLGYLTILNPNHEKLPVDAVEKVYLRVCEAIEREFNRPTPIRPRLVVRLGSTDNVLRYPMGEIQLKKWDEYRFADAVLDLAMHEILPPEERVRLSNSAVHEAGSTVSVCELKGCSN